MKTSSITNKPSSKDKTLNKLFKSDDNKENETIKDFYHSIEEMSTEETTALLTATKAMEAVKFQVKQNPEILKKVLDDYIVACGKNPKKEGSQFKAWTNTDAQKYLQDISKKETFKLLKSLVLHKGPLSEPEYTKEIMGEVVRHLVKKTMVHKKDTENRRNLIHNYLSLVNKANKMQEEGRPQKEIDKVNKQRDKCWLQAREIIDPGLDKVFRSLGEGDFGVVDSIVNRDAGFILVKKTIYDKTCPINVEVCMDLNHKNIVKFIPLHDSLNSLKTEVSYMEPSGETTLYYFCKRGAEEQNIREEELKKKVENIDDIVGFAKSEISNIDVNINDFFEELKESCADYTKTDIKEIIFLLSELLDETDDSEECEHLNELISLCEKWQENASEQSKYSILELDNLEVFCYSYLSALKYIHDMGVAHLDLHNGNVMLGSNGEITLIDFDLSKSYPGPKTKDNDNKFTQYKLRDLNDAFHAFHDVIFLYANVGVNLNLLLKRFPYCHQRERVDQLYEVLIKFHEVIQSNASIDDVIKLPFFSRVRDTS